MKKLLQYLKDYKLESVLAPLFKMLEASFELFVPLVVAQIIDRGIANNDYGYIVRMCLVLVALGIIGLVCSVTAQFFAAKAAVGFSTKLRHALFAHIQSLSHREIDSLGTSTLITRMTSDINQTQSGVNLFLRLFLRSPFVVFGAMIMAFTIDVPSALVFAVAIPVLAIVVFGIMLVTMPLYKKTQNALDVITRKTRENITGARVIRAFRMEDREIEDFNEKSGALVKLQKHVGAISALMNPLTYVLINAAVIALIYCGALRVDAGALTQGQVVALYNYMSQILVELIKLANMIITLTKALACANRISAIFDEKSSLENGTEVSGISGAPAVEFENAALTYSGSSGAAVERISFRAERGDTIGIIGGTGSGKTSLISLIPRFYDTSDGRVLVDGRDVREYDIDALRAKIGVVPQKAVLFKGTIMSNMKWGAQDADQAAIDKAVAAAQAEDVVRAKDGYEAEVEQGGANFSGGQKQRLTIARALAKKPEILILDDSASALDFATDARLRKAIASLETKPTVFIVSQRAASVMHADKIIVLDDGEPAGMGTHDELMENCDIYREIYNSQFGA
ncbi:MAG TPA: ABC transporter ATP-binding protein [Candidatus Ornithomonoglobus intestinigallinarum]|uniref:ABC transporter ATP-binding protein n=1 Tax=Candidatus Ornithomonoglobus intestinigallinarum TaxID=2840894 RepID=A0A9D1H598_9FIRM|nr:ABC transporter ATP-binding protein [Candidatus Ornithomonoglobus intestinigallinarum]